jgi:hypothetical protein
MWTLVTRCTRGIGEFVEQFRFGGKDIMSESETSPKSSDPGAASSAGAASNEPVKTSETGEAAPVPPVPGNASQTASAGGADVPPAAANQSGQSESDAKAARTSETSTDKDRQGGASKPVKGANTAAAAKTGTAAAKKGEQESPAGGEKEGAQPVARRLDDFVIIVLACAFTVLVGFVIQNFVRGDQQQLQVLAQNTSCAAEAATKGVKVDGVVLEDTEPCPKATVVAVGTDNLGNQLRVSEMKTDEAGKFTFDLAAVPCPQVQYIASVKIDAKSPPGRVWFTGGKTGSTELKLEKGGIIQEFSSFYRYMILLLFALSLALAIFTPSDPVVVRLQHYLSIVVTCLLSVFVVLAIGRIMMLVDGLPEQRGVARLGFATIFKASYVKDVGKEWVISLTAPPSSLLSTPAPCDKPAVAAAGQNDRPATSSAHTSDAAAKIGEAAKGSKSEVAKSEEVATSRSAGEHAAANNNSESGPEVTGLGAPLWVLFLGTIGAMLLTIGLIVQQLDLSDIVGEGEGTRADQRKRLQSYVQHSFFVLFAPFGAIFVYQLAVAAKAANGPLIVGIIALGTGPTLQLLLERAVQSAKDLFVRSQGDAPSDVQKKERRKASEGANVAASETGHKAPEAASHGKGHAGAPAG